MILERANQEEQGDYSVTESDRQDENKKSQLFKLEILAGNARKVSSVRFERITHDESSLEMKGFMHLVSEITKAKGSTGEETDQTETDGVQFQVTDDNCASPGKYVVNVKEDHFD